MIYVLYGNEEFLIKKEIETIIKKNNLSSLNINNYDLMNDYLKNILEDAQTISLFEEKKLIIVDNSYIFTGSNPKDDKKDNIEELLEYFEHINPDCILVFIVHNEKLDERKKVVKNLKKIAAVKKFTKSSSPNEFVKELLKDYQIDSNLVRLLIDRVGTNLGVLEQEINKIKIYKEDDKEIIKEDILELTSKNVEIDIFDLIDKIVNKDKENALEIYYEMLKRNEEPIKILIILANQFRIMYQAKELYQKGYSGNDIASILNIHPYRIKLALEKTYQYKTETLLSYLSSLADLDYDIKVGNKDAALGLELFILGGI